MTMGDQIEAYVGVLLELVDEEHLFRAVEALMARDSASRWFDLIN